MVLSSRKSTKLLRTRAGEHYGIYPISSIPSTCRSLLLNAMASSFLVSVTDESAFYWIHFLIQELAGYACCTTLREPSFPKFTSARTLDLPNVPNHGRDDPCPACLLREMKNKQTKASRLLFKPDHFTVCPLPFLFLLSFSSLCQSIYFTAPKADTGASKLPYSCL